MANILITGANGQLGSEFQKRTFSLLDEIFYTDIEELDITDLRAVISFVERNDIDTIINCAAYTAVDRAEEDAERAAKINRDAVKNLATAATRLGCLLVHISTDYVFDGQQDHPYTEKDTPNPQTVYGRTKWEGEQAIRESGCMHIIIRTAWLYSEFGNNFVETMLRVGSEREDLNVVHDQLGSPTYAGDLADAIIKILERDDLPEHEGTYHYSNEGICSWYEFAKEIMKLGEKDCEVHPITTAEYPTKAQRPAYSVLDKTKMKETFGVEVPEWRTSLRGVVEKLCARGC